MSIKLSENLYKKLPNIYVKEDAKAIPSPYPLQRFLKILGEGGFDVLEGYINDLSDIFDTDVNKPEFLPVIASMLGIQFPYEVDMDEAMQRKFLKALPSLYKMKGTGDSFSYLARELFGYESSSCTVYTADYVEGMSLEEWAKEKVKFFVRIEADGEIPYVADNINVFGEKFNHYAEIIRPANKKLITHFALIYRDMYDIFEHFDDLRWKHNLSVASESQYDKVVGEIYFPPSVTQVLEDISNITANAQANILDSTKYVVTVDQYDRIIKSSDSEKPFSISFSGAVLEDIFTRNAQGDSVVKSNVTYTRPSSTLVGVTKLVTNFYTNNVNHYTSMDY